MLSVFPCRSPRQPVSALARVLCPPSPGVVCSLCRPSTGPNTPGPFVFRSCLPRRPSCGSRVAKGEQWCSPCGVCPGRLPLLMPVVGVSPGRVTIPFLVVALIDIWAHRCPVSFCSSTTGRFVPLPCGMCCLQRPSDGVVPSVFRVHPRLPLSRFDIHGSSTLSPSVTLQVSFTLHVAHVGQVCERSLSLSSLSLCLSL